MTPRWSNEKYWDWRYREGRTSGAGSEGDAAVAKGMFINSFVKKNYVTSIVDWGIGDGVVLSHITPDVHYIGIDVSSEAIKRVQRVYKSDSRPLTLMTLREARAASPRAELAISSDVIFHQVNDADYYAHLKNVFASAFSFVLIHSTNHDGGRQGGHVRWRRFTPDVTEMFSNFTLLDSPEDQTAPGWYTYKRERQAHRS